MSDTIALYRRILSLLTPQELHRGSNCVLCDELSALQCSVDTVMATFIKVGEVRDAVNQLNQGKPSTGYDASLMDTMDRTIRLQKELGIRLEKVAAGMKVMEVLSSKEDEDEEEGSNRNESRDTRKRKAVDTIDDNGTTEIKEEVSAPEDEETTRKKKKKRADSHENDKIQNGAEAKRSADAKKQSKDFSLAHDALNAILKVKTVNKRMHMKSESKWALALSSTKRVLEHQSIRDTHDTDKEAAAEAARALEAAAEVYKKLEWTTEGATEARSALAVLTDACIKNKMLTVVFHRARAQLESVISSIPAYLTQAPYDTESTIAHIPPERWLKEYYKLVNSVRARSPQAKAKQVIEALIAIQKVMAGDDTGARQVDVQQSAGCVRRWITDVPFQSDLAREYVNFANSITAYSMKLSGEQTQAECQRLGTDILALLNEKTESSKLTTNARAQPRISGTMEKMQGRLLSAMSRVKSWQGGYFSMSQLDGVIRLISDVVSYKVREWNSYTEQLLRKCLKDVTSSIRTIQPTRDRERYLKKITKWETMLDTP
ncbi:unnamed protein product [Hyaloperonospora brassicae]|uniref:Uncharacterized protein n=1 Tax=Hyaloperonospora brassicae TaxID=162125 RepID=A0AAV0U3D7_HYABA|nr:unnamed protein product [Hyaloperonospora brassicae]